MKNILAKILIVVLSAVAITSCDKDFNTIGSEIVGNENYDFDVYSVQNLKAFSKRTNVVQSNNLAINALGIYDNSFFGQTKASFVTQVELATEGLNLGFEATVDSVYLYIPYFVDTNETETATNGDKTYKLDSVYGYNENAKFRLKVYENNYVLNDFNPDPNNPFQDSQRYYNNQGSDVSAVKGEQLNTGALNQNDEFVFSNKDKKIYKTDGNGAYVGSDGEILADQLDTSLRVVKERKAAGMWLDLKSTYFQQKILDQPNTTFFNNNVFKNHFKGLLFEVEELAGSNGALAMLDLSKAEFKILFRSKNVDEPTATRIRKTISLQMGYSTTGTKKSNTISFLEYTNNPLYESGLNASNEATGDELLYIKGGQGSLAFLELFGDSYDGTTLPSELTTLRENKWLINQANLEFYIDTSKMGGANPAAEPQRIYIYDATNNRTIIDYVADNSTSSNPKNNKRGFNGIISKDSDGRGIKYTFKITEYIKNVLYGTNPEFNKNIRIGIAVTESINISQFAYLNPANPINVGGNSIKFLPVASVMNPLGTVLYGTNASVPEDKKVKLNIYYTKPN